MDDNSHKMRDFLLAPFLSLFSPKFYRRLLDLPQALGFLYLAYLSLFLSVWALFMFRLYSLPVADELTAWLAKGLPEMTFTREGVQMELKEPLLLTHPRWGPLLYLDPASDSPKTEDLEKTLVVITRTKVAYRDPATGESRIRNLTPKEGPGKWRDLTITGNVILNLWKRLKPLAASLFFIVAFVGFYLWKLLAGLLYSIVGLLFNHFRTERLPYPSLLNLTFFALTPVVWLQIFAWSFTKWPIPLNFLTAFLVTTLYLAFAVLFTQERRAQTE